MEKLHRQRAVKKIWFFLIITFGLSSVCWVMMRVSELFNSISLIVMWVPGVAVFITMRIFKEKKDILGWKIGKIGYILFSLFVPIVSGVLIYGSTWLFHLGALNHAYIEKNMGIILYLGSAGIIFSTFLALGEEIGWRGYLVPKLIIITTPPRAALICGLIHALWHVPFILFLDYPGNRFGKSAWLGLLSITIQLTAGSVLLVWLRIKSGSVWTAALIHGTHNIFIQDIFDAITLDTGPTKYIVGEYGFGLSLFYIILAIIFWRKLKTL